MKHLLEYIFSRDLDGWYFGTNRYLAVKWWKQNRVSVCRKISERERERETERLRNAKKKNKMQRRGNFRCNSLSLSLPLSLSLSLSLFKVLILNYDCTMDYSMTYTECRKSHFTLQVKGYTQVSSDLRKRRFSPLFACILQSSGTLRSADWLRTDVSELPIGPIFKDRVSSRTFDPWKWDR